jgi:hypothetical protein
MTKPCAATDRAGPSRDFHDVPMAINPYEHIRLGELVPPDNYNTGLSDEDLIKISVAEFNRTIKRCQLTKNQEKNLKLKRRTLKNRGYAAQCRKKTMDRIRKDFLQSVSKFLFKGFTIHDHGMTVHYSSIQ